MLPVQSKTTDDNKGQETSKSAKNKVVTTSKAEGESTPNEPNTVPTADRPNTMNVTSSDKLDNKLSNKPTDLAVVIEAWPELPSAIRSAILAIVRSSNEQYGDMES